MLRFLLQGSSFVRHAMENVMVTSNSKSGYTVFPILWTSRDSRVDLSLFFLLCQIPGAGSWDRTCQRETGHGGFKIRPDQWNRKFLFASPISILITRATACCCWSYNRADSSFHELVLDWGQSWREPELLLALQPGGGSTQAFRAPHSRMASCWCP